MSRLLTVILLLLTLAPCAFADQPAPRVITTKGDVTFDAMLDELAKADVVFVGEQHDHARGHQLELEILKGLAQRNPQTSLALEMFERDVQLVLDEYLRGEISEKSFLDASRPWPNYKTDYAPLVELCKEKKLPVVAANAPRRYVSVASRSGQEALTKLSRESRSYLARLPYSMELPAGYDKKLDEVFGGHAGMPGMPHVKEGQALWDCTMADSIANHLRRNRGRRVVAMNGAMHSDEHFGVADRLHRLNGRLKVLVVSIRPDAEWEKSKDASAGDFVILTPPKTAPTR